MKLCEKIVTLRKSKGMSQEELAYNLNVSRQAVSRWEVGSAMPDAANILQLSKLFCVSADYLLNEEYTCPQDIPRIQDAKQDQSKLILFFLIVLEVLYLPIQFLTVVIMRRNLFLCTLSFIPLLGLLVGFEWGYRKRKARHTKEHMAFRKRFYLITAWLSTYFPVRLLTTLFVTFDMGPGSVWIKECTILTLYICTAALLTVAIERRMKTNE